MFEYCELKDVVIDKTKPIAVDTETLGFYQKVRLVQLYQSDWDKVKVVSYPNELALQTVLAGVKQIYHNAHYDITTIQQTNTRWIPDDFEDTFLLARIALPKLGEYSLDVVMTSVLGYDPYKKAGLDKKKMQSANWAGALTNDHLTYAAIDVYHLLTVYEAVKHVADSMSYKLDKLSLGYALDFQWNGLPINIKRCLDLKVKNIKTLKENPIPVNPNSWKQVRAWLDTDESDDLALARLAAAGCTKSTLIRLHRKLLKQNNFLDKYAKPRIYGKFKPSARSGRFTSDDENLQQIPRALKCIVEAAEGKVLIYADYAQLELRTIAVITKCIEMIMRFKNYEDLHDFVAAMLFGADFSKNDRQITKTCNFNFLYAGGIAVFLGILLKNTGISITEAKANGLRNTWRKLFKEVTAWQQAGIRAHQQGKVWHTPFGRPYYGNLITDQLNIQNQGFGSEIAKLAMHYYLKDGKLTELGGILCNFIHDAYITECEDDPAVYMPIAEHMAKSMQTAWFEGCKMVDTRDVPMPVKVLIGKNWGDMENGIFTAKVELKGLEFVNG